MNILYRLTKLSGTLTYFSLEHFQKSLKSYYSPTTISDLLGSVYRSPTCPWNKQAADSAYSHCNTMYQYFVTALIFLIKLQGTSELGFGGIFFIFHQHKFVLQGLANKFNSAVQDQTRPICYARHEFYTKVFPVA